MPVFARLVPTLTICEPLGVPCAERESSQEHARVLIEDAPVRSGHPLPGAAPAVPAEEVPLRTDAVISGACTLPISWEE